MSLKGIIVHSGSADVGHYYTIVKQDGRWVKLDDSRASLFTPSNIESECFGGSFMAGEEWAQMGEQSKNAYVLIYEKEVKSLIKLEAESLQL
jgi:ubiquitin carboxyl-terminal hydrolase 34